MKCLILVFLFLVSSAFCEPIVYIVNPGVDLDSANSGRSYHKMRAGIERMGYKPFWINKPGRLKNSEIFLFHNFWRGSSALKDYPKEKLVLFMWEPPTVMPNMYRKDLLACFNRIYTWDDSLVDNEKFFKLYYPQANLKVAFHVPFEQKKFAVMVNCNKDSSHSCSLYGERKKIICFFENNYPRDFDLYGRGWSFAEYRSYRGVVDSKLACIKNYKFCFAYENMKNVQGYVTEKIFDAFKAGCVPVYWGAENITDYVPKNCFIDRRDFATDEELYRYLKTMEEQEYTIYLQNIKIFLQSDQALLFSREFYLHTIFEAIMPGYDKDKILTEQQLNVVQRALSVFN